MTTIDPTSQLVAIIRQQVADTRTENGARRTPAAASSQGAARTAARGMSELLPRRIKAIDPDDPQRNRKAFRVFLESALLNELGANLINDPAFYRLVDDVQRTMEDDADLRERIDEAGQLLLAANATRQAPDGR